MMVPPINLSTLTRNTIEKPLSRRLYLLSEGTLTEPSFLISLITRSDYMNYNDSVRFYPVERDGSEFGINSLRGMVDIAKKHIINKEKRFSKKRDKVIIFFDLDIYHESIEDVKRIIEENKKYIIFVFTNPAIELFLLLCVEGSYEKIIMPKIENILKNEKNEFGRRYIHQLLIDCTSVDPKDRSADFDFFSSKIDVAIRQEKLYISSTLSNPDKYLISNFGRVLERIRNNDFSPIDYAIL